MAGWQKANCVMIITPFEMTSGSNIVTKVFAAPGKALYWIIINFWVWINSGRCYPFLGYFPIQLISITPQLTFEQPKIEFSIKFSGPAFDFSILTPPCNTLFPNKMPLSQGMIPKSILSCNVSILPLHEKHKACRNPSPPFDL